MEMCSTRTVRYASTPTQTQRGKQAHTYTPGKVPAGGGAASNPGKPYETLQFWEGVCSRGFRFFPLHCKERNTAGFFSGGKQLTSTTRDNTKYRRKIRPDQGLLSTAHKNSTAVSVHATANNRLTYLAWKGKQFLAQHHR